MPTGMQIRDPVTLAPILDMTMAICRTLGSFETGTSDGSINIPALSTGEPFFVCTPLVTVTGGQFGGRLPVVIRSGTTISWQFIVAPGQGGRPNISVRVRYGVY